MTITRDPLHRSGRAALPHPALASGDDAKSPQGIGMTDARRGQPAVDEPAHPLPGDARRLTAPRAARGARAGRPGTGKARAPGRSWARRSSGCAHRRPSAAMYPLPGSGSCRRRRSSALTSLSFACNLFRIVCRSTVNRPFRFFPQMCVKPRKLNVSGFPCPRACRFSAAIRAELEQPRLLGMQLQAELREPLAQAPARNRSASARCWNPTTKSSANRTTITSPRACFCRHCWTQRSNT